MRGGVLGVTDLQASDFSLIDFSRPGLALKVSRELRSYFFGYPALIGAGDHEFALFDGVVDGGRLLHSLHERGATGSVAGVAVDHENKPRA